MKMRFFWVLLHRYTGLAMTIFLIVVGLTGSLLAFLSELDGAIRNGQGWGEVTNPNIFNRFGLCWLLMILLAATSRFHGWLVAE